MKAKINHADLLRLAQQLGENPDPALAKMLGFDLDKREALDKIIIEDMSIESASSGTSSRYKEQKLEKKKKKEKVRDFKYWYLESQLKQETDNELSLISLSQSPESRVRPKSAPLISSKDAQAQIQKLLLKYEASKKLDIASIVKTLSQNQIINKIPYTGNLKLPDMLYLIVDISARLEPAYPELQQYIDAAQQLFGSTRLTLLPINNPPTATGEILFANGKRLSDESFDNAAILYIGDQGAFSQESYFQHLCWNAFWDKLQRLNIPAYSISLASPDEAKLKYVNHLMAVIMRCEGPQPDQIRDFRLALNEGGLAEELSVWNHPNHTHPSQIADVKVDYLHKWANIYKSIPSQARSNVEKCYKKWRALIPPSTAAMEQLKGASLGLETIESPQQILNIFSKENISQSYLSSRKDLIKHIKTESLNNKDLQRASENLITAMYGEQQTRQIEEEKVLNIKQEGETLKYSFETGLHPQSQLKSPVFDKEGRIILEGGTTTSNISFESRQEFQSFKQIKKPNWANRIWHNKNGLHAAHQDGTEFILKPATQAGKKAKWQGDYNAWAWASDYGIDQYGLWAVLSVKSVNFKLRWIAEGSFIMGSPEDEKGRFDGEIQHKVTLTKGFWLAETSVTQAQWQSIMGNKQSKPKESNLPVNYVSWKDCQSFIKKLKRLVPEFNPQLPSEAQWEYACRAGTKTAYWWGDIFDKSKANNSDTLKEESNMPQNQWGLRSMSGNVREWCHDLSGDYSKQAVIDPIGATTGSKRVLRGRGWFSFARDLRSAFRDAYASVGRYGDFGLRLAGGFDPQASGYEAMLTADRRTVGSPYEALRNTGNQG